VKPEEERREELERAYRLRREKRQALQKVIRQYHSEAPAPVEGKKKPHNPNLKFNEQAARRKIILDD